MFQFDTTFQTLIEFYFGPSMRGVGLVILVFFLWGCWVQFFPESRLTRMTEYGFEKAYHFFGDILGKSISPMVISYVTTIFFVILVTNLIGVCLDFIAPVFGVVGDEFVFSQFIQTASLDLHFNIAIAFVSITLLVILQGIHAGGEKFLYAYLPLWGKGYVTLGNPEKKSPLYYGLFPFVKLADIILSLFLSFLDMVGLIAKVVSLSFRLFGNMVSGGMLLGMLVIGLSQFTQSYTSFLGGIQFPVVLPIILYLQGMLVACIQAMVFPLLVAIFIRVSQMDG